MECGQEGYGDYLRDLLGDVMRQVMEAQIESSLARGIMSGQVHAGTPLWETQWGHRPCLQKGSGMQLIDT